MARGAALVLALSFIFFILPSRAASPPGLPISFDDTYKIESSSFVPSHVPLALISRLDGDWRRRNLETENDKRADLSEDARIKDELLELKTHDRVDERVWVLAQRFFWIASVVVAALVFVGFNVGVIQVRNAVTDSIRRDVQDETNTLKESLITGLAETKVSAREFTLEFGKLTKLREELEHEAENVRSELETLRKLTDEASERSTEAIQTAESAIKQLGDTSNTAKAAFASAETSSEEAANAVARATSAERRLDKLTRQIAEASAGSPVIFFIEVAPIDAGPFSEFLIPIYLEGSNFGTEPGTVAIVGMNSVLGRMDRRFELAESEIEWSANRIDLHAISSETQDEIEQWVADLRSANKGILGHEEAYFNVLPIVEVTTKAGSTTEASWSDL